MKSITRGFAAGEEVRIAQLLKKRKEKKKNLFFSFLSIQPPWTLSHDSGFREAFVDDDEFLKGLQVLFLYIGSFFIVVLMVITRFFERIFSALF